jgi:hypothetical protein
MDAHSASLPVEPKSPAGRGCVKSDGDDDGDD